MPTNRTRRFRQINKTPSWVKAMLETGRPPARDAPGYSEFMGWIFFHELLQGLPDCPKMKFEMMMEARNAQ